MSPRRTVVDPAAAARSRVGKPAPSSLRAGPERITAAQFRARGAATPEPPPTPKGKAYRALGRLQAGELNKTELRYDAHLRRRLLAGEILWFRWHWISFRIAPSTHFRPDVAVQVASGHIEIHDVKGARAVIEEDAAVKMKVAAAQGPFTFAYALPQGRSADCGWTLEYIE